MNFKEQTTLLEQLRKLKAKLEFVPEKPGVYIHKNEKGEILYVGKANNLQSRLRSYFTSFENQSPKTKALVQKISDFDVILTENEYESLLLENNMIKHNHPPYNILLRDDKTYPYIRIDKNEDWPRVTLIRRKKNDSALYFGPYSLGGQINQVLGVVNRFFPLVKCTPFVFKTIARPCYYYDVKKCLGPCHLPVDKKEYNAHLENVIDILKGNYKPIVKRIKTSMKAASEAMDYERAALLRDQINALENLQHGGTASIDLPIDIDVIGTHVQRDIVTFYISFIRAGKLIGGNAVIVKRPLDELDEKAAREEIFSTFVCQYYQKKDIPTYILFSQAHDTFSKESVENIKRYLSEIIEKGDKAKSGKTNTHSIEFGTSLEVLLKGMDPAVKPRDDKRKLQDDKRKHRDDIQKRILDIETLAIKNAEQKFQEQIKIDESSNQMMMALKQILNLEELPRHIECYDISTFQGSQTVASQVVFKDGAPCKSEYKKYIIKDVVQTMDDFASLREVIRRRFHKKDVIPDLIVIDGGTPQIREVGWTLKALGLDRIHLIGLAKARTERNFKFDKVTISLERIVLPKRNRDGNLEPAAKPETIPLKQGTAEFRLLTQMRDEAHRFAISFHRQKRDKSSLKSVLSEIPGLGAQRRKKLLETYPLLADLLATDGKTISEKTKIPLHIILDLKSKLK